MARHARRRWVALLAAVAFVAGEVPLGAQGEPSIARVGITGNLRVEEDAIRVHLRSQPASPSTRTPSIATSAPSTRWASSTRWTPT